MSDRVPTTCCECGDACTSPAWARSRAKCLSCWKAGQIGADIKVTIRCGTCPISFIGESWRRVCPACYARNNPGYKKPFVPRSAAKPVAPTTTTDHHLEMYGA